MSKNFGTRGVAQATQLGKRGQYLVTNPGAPSGQRAEVRQPDGVALGRMAGATAVDSADFIPLGQAPSLFGGDPVWSLASAFGEIELLAQQFLPATPVVLVDIPIPLGFAGAIYWGYTISIGAATLGCVSMKNASILVRRTTAGVITLGAFNGTTAEGGVTTATSVVVSGGSNVHIRTTCSAPAIGQDIGYVYGSWRLMGRVLP